MGKTGGGANAQNGNFQEAECLSHPEEQREEEAILSVKWTHIDRSVRLKYWSGSERYACHEVDFYRDPTKDEEEHCEGVPLIEDDEWYNHGGASWTEIEVSEETEPEEREEPAWEPPPDAVVPLSPNETDWYGTDDYARPGRFSRYDNLYVSGDEDDDRREGTGGGLSDPVDEPDSWPIRAGYEYPQEESRGGLAEDPIDEDYWKRSAAAELENRQPEKRGITRQMKGTSLNATDPPAPSSTTPSHVSECTARAMPTLYADERPGVAWALPFHNLSQLEEYEMFPVSNVSRLFLRPPHQPLPSPPPQ